MKRKTIDMYSFDSVVTLTQNQLEKELMKLYHGRTIARKGSYILVRGEIPIMLCAHLDTVHKEPVKTICKSKNGIYMSPEGIGADDRAGVYALNTIYKDSNKKPWLLFCCDEEIGCVGSTQFAEDITKCYIKQKTVDELYALKFVIQIDRRGRNDSVYYDCANYEFEKYINSFGFRTEYGSCSDISVICPELGIAGVNLSSGYQNEHTLYESLNMVWLNETIRKVKNILNDENNTKQYEYVEGYNSLYFEDDIYGMYDVLCEIYDKDELDTVIAKEGLGKIKELYEEAFGTEAVSSCSYLDGWATLDEYSKQNK